MVGKLGTFFSIPSTPTDLPLIPIRPSLYSSKIRYLAVINPQSGSGKALKVFLEVIKPLWLKHGIIAEALVTRYAGHCIEVLEKDPYLTRFSAIVAIGGDGILAEIIEGLRENQELVFNNRNIPLGIIPLGSGNGLSTSLLYKAGRQFTIANAVQMTTKPKALQKLNLMNVTQKDRKQTGFLALTLGLVAEIDIRTEWMRCVGSLRYTVGAIKSILTNPRYSAVLSYLPEDSEWVGRSPLLSQPLSSEFVRITGLFTMIIVGNTTHCSLGVQTTPEKQFDEGYLHVVTVRRISRCALLRLLLGFASGAYIHGKGVTSFRTKILRLEPQSPEAMMTLDGEWIPTQLTQCNVHKKSIQVLYNSKS